MSNFLGWFNGGPSTGSFTPTGYNNYSNYGSLNEGTYNDNTGFQFYLFASANSAPMTLATNWAPLNPGDPAPSIFSNGFNRWRFEGSDTTDGVLIISALTGVTPIPGILTITFSTGATVYNATAWTFSGPEAKFYPPG
jgi:hypothetical protein